MMIIICVLRRHDMLPYIIRDKKKLIKNSYVRTRARIPREGPPHKYISIKTHHAAAADRYIYYIFLLNTPLLFNNKKKKNYKTTCDPKGIKKKSLQAVAATYDDDEAPTSTSIENPIIKTSSHSHRVRLLDFSFAPQEIL